jgi:hypothetical protein
LSLSIDSAKGFSRDSLVGTQPYTSNFLVRMRFLENDSIYYILVNKVTKSSDRKRPGWDDKDLIHRRGRQTGQKGKISS